MTIGLHIGPTGKGANRDAENPAISRETQRFQMVTAWRAIALGALTSGTGTLNGPAQSFVATDGTLPAHPVWVSNARSNTKFVQSRGRFFTNR